jgi:alanyl-tRNA synthetase
VKATGQIGLIKIISETGIAAGIRRIEAVTGTVAVAFYNQQLQILEEIKTLVKNPVDALKGVKNLLEEKQKLTLEVENLRLYKINSLLQILSENIKKANGINFLSIELDVDVQMAKDLLFDLKRRFSPFVGLIAYINQNKPGFSLIVSDELIETGKVDARELVKVLSPCIKGSGGGQAGFVTAGGSFTKGVSELLDKAKQLFAQIDS